MHLLLYLAGNVGVRSRDRSRNPRYRTGECTGRFATPIGCIDVEDVGAGAVATHVWTPNSAQVNPPDLGRCGNSKLAMSSETPDLSGSDPHGRKSPVKMNPPSLQKIASRFNMPTSQKSESGAVCKYCETNMSSKSQTT